MTAPFPVRLEDPGVPELLRDFEALRTWEVLRGAGTVCTIPDLVRATSHEPLELHRQLDLLTAHGLVRRVRPRRPRTTIGYRTTTDRIVVTFDETSPESMAHAFASSEDVGNEFERCVEAFKDPAFHPKAGFRFRQRVMQHFTAEDLAELRRRMLAVVEFLVMPRSGVADMIGNGEAAHCNQAISITLEPLVGELLPLPSVWMTPASKLANADDRSQTTGGAASLAPREREIALALADGLTRKHVAEQLGLSVHTVATIARRVYRKLGVTSQAELAARLAGQARRELGER